MSHHPINRSKLAANEGSDWPSFMLANITMLQDAVGLLWLGGAFSVLSNPLCRLLFGTATNFADHDDALGIRVMLEYFERVNEIGAGDDVTAHGNAETLAKSGTRERGNRLVAQSP